ncbi:hypothetical protein GCM10010123_24570 [Pilimelia anulata]|uniref:HTH gntR-type domain-containing protein n=1 Tax=Pilimelia anulata TaxID=53371 RepID=A0A8J3B8U5_9ACTN|nr:GntR family transcriptional regulator [Pilimelia anulata]GGJ93806.1 hypothetical protein GCM10010123_24570 [Pilimelia anulata]
MAAHERLTKPDPRYQQVARNIRNKVEAGVLRHGDVLPSTRELAKQWRVSVFTINEAMRVLAEDGMIVNKDRSKRVVHAPEQLRRREIRSAQPHIVLIGGYAGSGKTELGRILARNTGWPILDKDTLTRPVVEAALEQLGRSPHDRESSTYLTKIRPREYESLIAATEENVACGNSAVVTAPFVREFNDLAWIERVKASFEEFNATTTLVWLYCDSETMHTYVRHRGAARDSAKLADWPSYLASIDIGFRPPAAHHVIDNCSSGVPLPTQARSFLREILGHQDSA